MCINDFCNGTHISSVKKKKKKVYHKDHRAKNNGEIIAIFHTWLRVSQLSELQLSLKASNERHISK